MFGEIFLCQFPFTSGANSKIRPALILFDLQNDAIICRVTSVLHNGAFDVHIKDWSSAGLIKPSVARIDRLVTAERRVFLRRLGVLSSSDRDEIRRTWNGNMKL